MMPFKLVPAFKDYIWGGTRLKADFNKQTGLSPVAESWELSAHPDGVGVIATGEFRGMLFSDFVREHHDLLGSRCADAEEFPLLIKLIDAKDSLSIQVHPDDVYARRVEGGQGKTEMWYILDCEPGAFLYYGFEREISAAELREQIEGDTITEVLHKAPVKKGDVFFIAAGTVHAIGAGILLAEIQQNSNTTYRVYDFGRLGVDGKPRALHVDKAAEVAVRAPAPLAARGSTPPVSGDGYSICGLAKCEYFSVRVLTLTGSYTDTAEEDSFVSLLCTDGSMKLRCKAGELALEKGDSVFVPAKTGEFSLSGSGQAILTTA